MFKRFYEIFEYIDMITGWVKRDLRGRYKGSLLGFAWNLITPLCQIIVYYVVFSTVFNNEIQNFHIYLVTGMVPWNFFSEAIIQGAASIVANADMTKKIYFPREVLPISSVASRFVNLLLTLSIVMVLILISGHGLNLKMFPWLLVTLLIEFVLALAVALLLSAINVYYHDIEYITNVIMMVVIWVTPIMYSLDSINTGYLSIIVKLNPMTTLIDAYHKILYYKQIPNIDSLLFLLVMAVVLLIISENIFIRLEKKFAEEL